MLYCRLVGKALEKKGSESKSDYSLVLAKLIERLQLKEQLEASVSDESEEVDMRLENLAHTAVCIIYQTLSLPPFLSLSLSLSSLSDRQIDVADFAYEVAQYPDAEALLVQVGLSCIHKVVMNSFADGGATAGAVPGAR